MEPKLIHEDCFFDYAKEFDLVDEIHNNLIEKKENALDFWIKEGLRKRGFSFKNELDFLQFIKTDCQVVDRPHNNQREYYVWGDLFLLENYNPHPSFNWERDKDRIIVFADLARFTYIHH